MHLKRFKILSNFFRKLSTTASECQERVKKERRKVVKKKCLSAKEQEKLDIEKAVLEKFQQKAVRVCVIGADTTLGEMTSFMLKQNPIVSRLFLTGGKRVRGIAADLNQIDTRSIASGHAKDLPGAVRGADIILLLGKEGINTECSVEDKLRNEGDLLIERATICSYYAPRSIIIVCVDPICVTLPLVRSVFKAGNWYHPGKIIGSVALSQIRANTLLARYQGLDPISVDVPLIGGPDVDTIIPLFTNAQPVATSVDECILLIKKFRGLSFDVDLKDCKPVPTKYMDSPFSEAFAINRMVTNIGVGVCGDEKGFVNACVRTNLFSNCSHITSTVKFSVPGLVHNFGLPRLYKSLLHILQRSTMLGGKREKLADEYFYSYVERMEQQMGGEESQRAYGPSTPS